MNSRHWTDHELLNYLYGLTSADEHFNSCADCAARAGRLAGLRAESAQSPQISDEVLTEILAAQRRSIYQRLGAPIRSWHPLRWTAAGIAMLSVVLGLTMYQSNQSA